ncbi:hypothetical protein CH330_00345 [candidate division WOR-3 bacterium JGI_Cruoil_03_51_56]|uniref:Uncharacterized protein n=1 Tax=candidate division WOR-3 bacterium JGI_Cruoil_03_51_56 TaxID=1973747 RepID=A0A235BYE6_UNCW3|nr:MAG: hypothetical protein CH330_00345 [candidate division WOR-3 bacterium JGI_Cruoil_03_51_56]
MKIGEILGKIDRRIVFGFMAIVVIVPFFFPLNVTGKVAPPSQQLFDAVEEIQPDSKPLLISIDFDPQSMPELYPMLKAILRHAFSRNVRVCMMALWVTGVGLGEAALNEVAPEYGKVHGKDYVYLGWKPGFAAVVLGMGKSIPETFPTDQYGTPLESIPMMRGVKNFRDIPYAISISAGDPGALTLWIPYVQSRFGQKLGTGMTAVSAADAYPYLQSGQLTGLLGGMKGAAEYEHLVAEAGYSEASKPATQAMDSQSMAHLAIILLIVLGNIGFILTKGRK